MSVHWPNVKYSSLEARSRLDLHSLAKAGMSISYSSQEATNQCLTTITNSVWGLQTPKATLEIGETMVISVVWLSFHFLTIVLALGRHTAWVNISHKISHTPRIAGLWTHVGKVKDWKKKKKEKISGTFSPEIHYLDKVGCTLQSGLQWWSISIPVILYFQDSIVQPTNNKKMLFPCTNFYSYLCKLI